MTTTRAERRLSAIMAADIVGYSRLIEADEAATLAAITALRAQIIDPLLAEYKGRIVKLMGDGAIVEFGSVVDAVACAVAHPEAGRRRASATSPPERRIVFRIGINLGDVVVDGDDLLGDGVNVAARLEQLCAGRRAGLGHRLRPTAGQARSAARFRRRAAGQEHLPAGPHLQRQDGGREARLAASHPGAAPLSALGARH